MIKQQREKVYKINQKSCSCRCHKARSWNKRVTEDWYEEDLAIVVYLMQMDLRILIQIHKCWESIIKIYMHELVPRIGCCTNCCTWNV